MTIKLNGLYKFTWKFKHQLIKDTVILSHLVDDSIIGFEICNDKRKLYGGLYLLNGKLLPAKKQIMGNWYKLDNSQYGQFYLNIKNKGRDLIGEYNHLHRCRFKGKQYSYTLTYLRAL